MAPHKTERARGARCGIDYPNPTERLPYGCVGASTERLIDVGGLACRLGVGERFVRRLVHERRIPFVKVGRYVRFEPDDVEQWILNSRVEPTDLFVSLASQAADPPLRRRPVGTRRSA